MNRQYINKINNYDLKIRLVVSIFFTFFKYPSMLLNILYNYIKTTSMFLIKCRDNLQRLSLEIE